MRILVLKHPLDAQLIINGLGNFGHEFLFAPSADSAIDLLKQTDVDLIIQPSESESVRFCNLKDDSLRAIPVVSIGSFTNEAAHARVA